MGIHDDQKGRATSYRQIVEYLAISADGKPLGELSLNPYGFTVGPDLIEVFSDGLAMTVRKCSYNESLTKRPMKSCTEETP